MTRLLGIEVTPDELRLARAERRLGATRLVACARVPCSTPDARRAALVDALAWRPSAVVASLPLAALAHRVLTLPFRDPRRVGETVLLELLGQLPHDPGDVAAGHLTLDTTADGTRVVAALARRAAVDGLCSTLAGAGVRPDRVDAALVGVAHLLDPARAADVALAPRRRRAERARRAARRAARAGWRALSTRPAVDPAGFDREVRWTLAALGGAPRIVLLGAEATGELATRIARATALPAHPIAEVAAAGWRADALAACAVAAGLVAGPGLVLHQEAPAGNARRVAALAAAVVLLAVVDLGLVRWQLVRRDAALVAAVRTTATAALPAGTRIVAPRAQLEAAAGSLAQQPGTAGDVLALLRELSARLPADVRLALDELALEGDALRIRGRTDRFEAIDLVTRALATSAALHDVVAEESRAALDGNGVEFGVRATWRPAVGAPS